MKKFLSLVLAMIMTMSLVTISAGATEYKDLTDKDEIKYEEAVAVLNRIGVITGYPDGSFQPETELTRGAAAKIIVSLMIGPDAAAALPNTSSPYPDVPAGHTFAGVISYCKTKNYISGYGDGTFKPTGTLTGYAFAKMLLGALGYSSDIERFTGSGWTMNVANVGNVAGLFDRISFDGAAAVTRDEACQLALNTLKATIVTYGGTSVVNGSTGSYTIQNTQATPKTSNNRDINANIGRKDWYGGNNKGSDYLTLEFGEEHFKDLRLEHDRFDPAHDDFGRPSNEWSYKKVTIGTFPLEAEYTFTTQVAHIEDTDGTKEKALGLRNFDLVSDGGYSTWNGWGNDGRGGSTYGGTTTLWLNGLEDEDYFSATKDGKLVRKVANIADFTDNGTLVEVYVSNVDADWITDVVVIQTQLMEVKKVGSDYVSLEKKEPDAFKNNSPRGTANTGFNLAPIEVTIEQVKDSNEDCYSILKDLKSGDEVAVIPVTTDNGKTYEAAEVYVPETVSGALTRVDTYGIGTDSEKKRGAVEITVGGTSYKIADWNDEMWDLKTEAIKATRKDVTLLMDKYGNAMLAKDVGATNDFMVVGHFYQALAGNKVCTFVHGWDIAGNEIDLNLGSTIRIDDHDKSSTKYGHVLGELVYYTSEGASGDADYVLRHISNDGKKSVHDIYTNLRNTNSDTKVADYDSKNPTATANYEIKASNLLVPLVKEVGNDYCTSNTKEDGSGFAKHRDYATTEVENFYYDKSVKFIYVNYVNDDDEIESVEFKSGVQNVSHDELRQAIQFWPAQAAVKSNQVKAVVIKRESNDASINRMLYVTKTLGFKEYDAESNQSFYEVEVAMFTSDGKFLTEQHVVVNKDLQIGQFATYTKVDGTKYEDNYYRVKTFERHNANPAALRTVDPAKVIDTTNGRNEWIKTLLRLNPDKTYSLANTSKPLVKDIGSDGIDAVVGTESYALGGYRGSSTTVPNSIGGAEGVIRTDRAEWLNATRDSKWDDIDSVEDLFDETNGKFTLDILLNEKPDSDGFRTAYLIVLKSVDGASGNSGGASGSNVAEGTNYSFTSRINKAGQLPFTITATRPDWVPSGATATITGTIYVDGVAKTFTTQSMVNSVDEKTASFSDVFTAFDVDEDSTISVAVSSIKWNKVKVELENAPQGVTLVTKDVPTTGSGATITVTNPGTAYESFNLSVKQGDDTLLVATPGTPGNLDITLTLTTNPANSKEAVKVIFSDVKKTVADVEPVTDLEDKVESGSFNPDASGGLDAIKALGTGVYTLENLTNSSNPSSPFYQTCSPKDTRTFVFDKDGSGSYTLRIGDSGEYYTETFTAPSGDQTASLFNVQVSKLYSNVFHNTDSATGSMHDNGTPLSKGTYNWTIKAGETLLASGTIAVDGLSSSQSTPYTPSEAPVVTEPTVEGGGSQSTSQWKEATDKAIKDSPDGVYNFPVEPEKVTGTDLAIHGDQSDNFVFKFTCDAEEVVFYMWNGSGVLVERETQNFSAGPHFFFYQLTGSDFANGGDSGFKIASSLQGQNCEWRIVGSKSGIIDQGVIAVPASGS